MVVAIHRRGTQQAKNARKQIQILSFMGVRLSFPLLGSKPGRKLRAMKKILLTVLAVTGLLQPAGAAGLSKTYSYFSVGGKTPAEIESELSKRGPNVKSTGGRHPGAIQIEFKTHTTYAGENGGCKVATASVTVQAKIFLPRWRQREKANGNTRLYWDTRSADIRRHEETHVIIAKNHAWDIEQALMRIRQQRDCTVAEAKAKATTNRIIALSDRAQREFDRVEGINFESRFTRLLHYRMERIEQGKQPG
jgi:predicted secreted Zn-dependent protease